VRLSREVGFLKRTGSEWADEDKRTGLVGRDGDRKQIESESIEWRENQETI
jgi:hypothetical protein